MPADFPSSPTLNQTYTFGGRTWAWNGTGWQLVANSTDKLTLTDGLVVPAASAATPSVRFTGSLSTGVYSPGTDQVAISTGGTGRLFVVADGRVAIGASSVSSNSFEITDTNASLRFRASSSGSYTSQGIFFQVDSNTQAHIYNDGPGNIVFRNTSSLTERMRLDSSGRLLVGTSSARANAFAGGVAPQVQMEGTNGATSSLLLASSRNDIGQAFLVFGKSRSTSVGGNTSVASGDILGTITFQGADGTNLIEGARIESYVDATPGLNDMPGRLVFATTADGASTPTERMRIDNQGNVAIGPGGTAAGYTLLITKNITGAVNSYGVVSQGQIQSDVTTSVNYYTTSASTQAAAFTLTNLYHYQAQSGTFGAGSTVSNQIGYLASSSLTGATNNFGFYGNIPSGTGRWNFYAGGTADSYFASNNFIFANGGTERGRWDSSGRLLVGTSSSVNALPSVAPVLQVAEGGGIAVGVLRSTNDAFGGNISFRKTRGVNPGDVTVVQNSDALGRILWIGTDGTNPIESARIEAAVDGTPGTNDMPGRIVLSTTADGAAAPTEQWRINNAGTVIYNQPAPAAVNTTATLTVANLTAKIITSTTAAAVTMTLPLGTDMDAGFSGLYTNMAFEWYVINTGGTNAVTVAANTAHTIVGSGTVSANNSGKFLSRRTAATTWVTYRLSS